MQINDAKIALIEMLKFGPLLQCANVVSNMKVVRRLHAGNQEVLHSDLMIKQRALGVELRQKSACLDFPQGFIDSVLFQ